jgi:hypothetical protein
MPYKLADTNVSVDTPSGAAWAEKYLHPPSALKPQYAGIPDLNSTASVNLEYRLECEQAQVGNNAVLYVIPPSIMRQAFKFTIAGTSITDSSADMPVNRNVTIDDFAKTSESYRMGYRSTTLYQDSTAFNNNGMVYTSQFRPNIATYTDHDLTAFAERYAGHQGISEVMKQIKARSPDDGFTKLGGPTTPSPGNTLQVISLGRIPLTGGDVLMKSPHSTARRACEGAFVVQQFSEPTQRYVSLARHYTKRSDPATSYSVFNYYEFIDDTGKFFIASFKSSDGGAFSPDIEWYDMTWAFMMIVTPDVPTYPCSYILKTIVGVDVQPVSGTLLQSVVKESALYDMQALRMSSMLRQRMPDSLPASSNDFASVAATVMNWAPKIWGAIKSIFGGAEKPEIKKEVKKEVKQELKAPKPANAKKNKQRGAAKTTQRRTFIQTQQQPPRPLRQPPPRPIYPQQTNMISAPPMTQTQAPPMQQRVVQRPSRPLYEPAARYRNGNDYATWNTSTGRY